MLTGANDSTQNTLGRFASFSAPFFYIYPESGTRDNGVDVTKFFGVAQAAGSAGQFRDVVFKGGISTVHTGLTPLALEYVNNATGLITRTLRKLGKASTLRPCCCCHCKNPIKLWPRRTAAAKRTQPR